MYVYAHVSYDYVCTFGIYPCHIFKGYPFVGVWVTELSD